MPIVTIRNATGPGDAAQSLRQALTPAGQRAETIQKIVDALGRHLSGQEALSRDALVRLIDDLSKLLKSSALPPENGRALARRLMEVFDSLPAPERLAIERELAGRSPAQRIAATDRPSTATAAPAAERTTVRSLPLPAPLPQYPVARVPASGDMALLQATLRKTFGGDDEAGQIGQAPGDEPAPEAGIRPDAARAESAADRSTRPPTDGGKRAPSETLPGTAGDGAAEAEAAQRPLPQASRAAAPSPPAAAGSDARGASLAEAAAAKPAETEAAMEDGVDAAADEPDADGTYRPARAKGENGRQQARPAALLRASLADAMTVLASDRSGVAEKAAATGRPAAPERADNAPQPTPEHALADRPRDTALRPRNAMAGAQPLADPPATETPDAPAPSGASLQQQSRPAGDEPPLQQAIALLTESGLLKELVPFALVPYPPAEAEAEGGHEEEPPQDSRDEDEAGADDGDDEHAGRDDDTPEEPEAADAYDLYRKLSGLG